MVIAATYKDEKVYQHFGHTPHFKIYTVTDDGQIGMEVIDTKGQGHKAMADLLYEKEVNVLICGDIGLEAYRLLDEYGIRIYAGYSDYADICMVAYLHDNLVRATEAVCEGHDDCEKGECGDCHCGGDCGSCHF